MKNYGRLFLLIWALGVGGPGAACQVVGPLGLGADLGTAVRVDRDRTEQERTPLIVGGLTASLRSPNITGSRAHLYAAVRGEIGAGRSAGDRYRFVPLDDGSGDDRSLCIDTRTGQPAGRGACVSTYGGVSGEGGTAVGVRGAVVRVGAGYRAGMGRGPFGAVTVSGARILYVRAEAGVRGGALVVGIGSF